jgi:DNA-binding NarL/FixJ family response regulator
VVEQEGASMRALVIYESMCGDTHAIPDPPLTSFRREMGGQNHEQVADDGARELGSELGYLRPREPTDALSALTEQERRVLDLVAEGLTNRQIGERMFLSEKTVKNYVSSVLAKLGLNRRSEAAAFAARLEERRRHRRD